MPQEPETTRALKPSWFQWGISAGVLLAVLLLGNSISTYFSIAHRIVQEQGRRELSRQVSGLEKEIQQSKATGAAQLTPLLARVRERGGARLHWIQIRDGENRILAQSGQTIGEPFPATVVRDHLRNRQRIFETREAGTEKVLVEVFPLLFAAAAGSQTPPLLLAELAVALDSAEGAFWPIRRDLMINCSAALALLLSLAVMGLRLRSYLDSQQLDRQVEIARQVQQNLLPSPKQALGCFELAAECKPASRVGGDFYDAFSTAEGGTAFVLGDVSGKGIPAALLMGVIHGAVRSSSWTDSPWRHEESTRQINLLLFEHASSERFASMFWAYFDPRTDNLHYLNAGHLPPLLFRAARSGPVSLTEGGPVLGLLASARFQQGTVRVEPGDVLVLFSDGIAETENAAGEQFGEQRLAAAVQGSSEKTADEIRDCILTSVRAFSGDAPLEDDRTLLVVRRHGRDVARREDCAAKPLGMLVA